MTKFFLSLLLFLWVACDSSKEKKAVRLPEENASKLNPSTPQSAQSSVQTNSHVPEYSFKPGIIFKSSRPGEQLRHVRVFRWDSASAPHYFFIGATVPQGNNASKDFIRIYELYADGTLYQIDSMGIEGLAKWTENIANNEYELDKIIKRQYDNLRLFTDQLHYYKEYSSANHPANWGKTLHRKYFSYKIKSQHSAQKITRERFRSINERMSLPNGLYSMTKTWHGSWSVLNDLYDLHFFRDFEESDGEEDEQEAYFREMGYRFDRFDTSQGDFSLSKYFTEEFRDENSKPCDPQTLLGGVDWHQNGTTVFFDNSAVCMACIWEFDIKTRKISKLVAEHHAIHPWYFYVKNKEYIAYVQKDEIRLIEYHAMKQYSMDEEGHVSEVKEMVQGDDDFQNQTTSFLKEPIQKLKLPALASTQRLLVNSEYIVLVSDSYVKVFDQMGEALWQNEYPEIDPEKVVLTPSALYISQKGVQIQALNLSDGHSRWIKRLEQGLFTPIWWDSSSNQILLGAKNQKLLALDAQSSELNWTQKLKGKPSPYFLAYRKLFVVSDSLGNVSMRNFHNGEILWEYHSASSAPQLLKGKDHILVLGNDGVVEALNEVQGFRLTKYSSSVNIDGSAMVHKDVLLLQGIEPKYNRRLVAIETSLKSLLWQIKMSLSSAPIVLQSGDYLIHSDKNLLMAKEIYSGNLKWKIDLTNSISQLALYNNRIYCVADQALVVLEDASN